MKDFLGTEIQLGDMVVLTQPNYRNLVRAKVIAFTPKKVRVEYRMRGSSPNTYLSEPDFLVVIKNGRNYPMETVK